MPRVRRLIRWTLVTLGIVALVRWLRRRGEEPAAPTPSAGDPADELRRKLAESRGEAEPVAASPTPPNETAETVEARRAEVHEQGRSVLSEMAPPDEA